MRDRYSLVHSSKIEDCLSVVKGHAAEGGWNNSRMDDVGSRIKKERKARNLTQAQVGTAVGINQTSVKDIELGNTKSPAAITLVRMAKLFDVDPEWLLTGKGARNPVATFTTEEVELLLLFRDLTPEGRAYLLGRAKTLHVGEHTPAPQGPRSNVGGNPYAKPPKDH